MSNKSSNNAGLAEGEGGQGGAKAVAATAPKPGAPAPKNLGAAAAAAPDEERGKAKLALDECRQRWQGLRQEWTQTVDAQFESAVKQGENILEDDWETKDLIKDSAALLINSVDRMKDLYHSAYRFMTPKKKP